MLKKGDEVEVLSGCRKGSRGFVVKDYKPGEMLRVEFADKIIHYTEAGLRRLAKVERFHDETTVTLPPGYGVDVGRMKGLSNSIQTLPRVQVGEHIICSDPGIPEGSWVAISPRIYGTWLNPEEWAHEAYPEESAPFMPPCRCESLLKGHDKHCAHFPETPEHERERERERERLERCWAIPQPKEPLSYKTTMDRVGGNAPRLIQKTVKLAEAYGMGYAGIKKLLGGLKE